MEKHCVNQSVVCADTCDGLSIDCETARCIVIKNLMRNVLNYGLLETKGYGIFHRGQYRTISSMPGRIAGLKIDI